MIASTSGMPISCTHTVIGALLGAGIVASGLNNLNWTTMGKIVISWFSSPLVSAFTSFLIFLFTLTTTMNTKRFSFR